jgi:hypothetical protein|nr:MAG TPA: hypothetical protein [Caudoviricetes sp.]
MKGTIMINVRDFEHLVWHKKYPEIVEVLNAHPEVKKRFVRYWGEEVSVEQMVKIMPSMNSKELRVILVPNYYG